MKSPRAILSLDLTEQMRQVVEHTVRLTVEETLQQYLEANPPVTAPPELLTLQEAADMLKVTKATLDKWRADGVLKTIYIGPAVRISSLEILKFHYPE